MNHYFQIIQPNGRVVLSLKDVVEILPQLTAFINGHSAAQLQRALDDGKAPAKKAKSTPKKSPVKKAGTKPAHRK